MTSRSNRQKKRRLDPAPLDGAVEPIHPKAMLVLLTKPEEWSTWLAAPTEIAVELQRPLPNATMRIVAQGARRDPAA